MICPKKFDNMFACEKERSECRFHGIRILWSVHIRRFHNLRQFFLHDAWMQIYMHAWYTGKIDWIGSMNFKDRSFTRFTTIVGEDQSYIYD